MSNPIELLRQRAELKENEAIVITSGINRRYFSDFKSSAGVLVVTSEKAFLLLDFRYREAASKVVTTAEVMLAKGYDNDTKNLLESEKIKKVYLETSVLSYDQSMKYQKLFNEIGTEIDFTKGLDEIITGIRAVKTPTEVAKIKAAQKITDATFDYALTIIKEGMTELELALEIEFFMKRNGAEALAFDTIAVAGANSSLCHGVPSNYRIQKGDFITMDMGARLDGYHSDMTRTIVLGHASDEQVKIYNTVLKAHNEAMEAVKPGVVCKEIDKIARDIIDPLYPNAFGHGLGHSLGLEIHESPNFSALCNTVLEAGMILTDEPGIYISGLGGVRIEDMVLVTETGYESLTHSRKDLIIL